MATIKFSYRIVYKPGDYSDEKQHTYEGGECPLEEQLKDEDGVKIGEVCVPKKMAEEALAQIDKKETEEFLETEDPDEWGMEEVDDSWEITDSFRIELLGAEII